MKSPPPHLLAVISELSSVPVAADCQGLLNNETPQRDTDEDQSGICSGVAWLTGLQRILCGDATDLSDDEEEEHAPELADPAAAQEVCPVPVLGMAVAKEGKQPKRGSKSKKRTAAATHLGQPNRPKKALDGAMGSNKRPVAAEQGAAAQQAAGKPPRMSLKERMQLNGLAQEERLAIAAAHNELPAADSTASFQQHGKPPADEGAGDVSASELPAAQEADEAAPQAISSPGNEERLSQQPLLHRLQSRLHRLQQHGPAADCQQSTTAETGMHAGHSAAEHQECNTMPPQMSPADCIKDRAAQMEARDQQHSSGPAPSKNHCPGHLKAPLFPDAVSPGANPEVCEVPERDGEEDAQVVVLSQMPLACRLPQARRRAAAPTPAQQPPGSQCLQAAALAGSASALQSTLPNRGGDRECSMRPPGAAIGAPSDADMQKANGVVNAAGMHACAAQHGASVQTSHGPGDPVCDGRSTAAAQQQSRLPVLPPSMLSKPPMSIVGGDAAAQRSGREEQPQQGSAALPRRAAVGNWDLLDELGGMDDFMAPAHDVTSCGDLRTPCVAPRATPGGASMEDPSSSSAAGWGRHAPKHRKVLWSPDDSPLATTAERPAQDRGPIDTSDSTGCFRRPVARRKRALSDTCTPGANISHQALMQLWLSSCKLPNILDFSFYQAELSDVWGLCTGSLGETSLGETR